VLRLSQEQVRLKNEAEAFTREEVIPVADRYDQEQRDVPWELIDRLGKQGYFGILIDPEYGGMGLGCLEYCIVSEELTRGWMSVASVIARGQGAGTSVADPRWRADLLRGQAAGKMISAGAWTEPDAGSDLTNVQCRAELRGDHYVVNGAKRWCGWAKAADFIILLARTGQDKRGGLDMFHVCKERGSFPEGMTGTPIPKIGYHGITSWALTITDLVVPAHHILVGPAGETGTGFSQFVTLINRGRVHTAARAVGAARGALEEATEYAKRRVQFGRSISSFQSIKFKLADMATEVEAARRLYYYAAGLVDAGEHCQKECSMAKLFASEMAERVTSAAMQIFGGNGYSTEYPVQRHWRDARLTPIFEGTSEIQRSIIARHHLQGEAS
jgi:alkylation response protein AidB-like acyl-CoA dehydrogenase